jgi:hypothetical protein
VCIVAGSAAVPGTILIHEATRRNTKKRRKRDEEIKQPVSPFPFFPLPAFLRVFFVWLRG